MKKRLFILFLVCTLVLSLPICVYADEGNVTGVRTVEFTADWSDLENFVNGGRSHFDLVLRSVLPEWASYKLRTHNRDTTLTLEFPFDSIDDYETKVATLILRTPTLVFQQDGGLLWMENCTSIDLLNFLVTELEKQGCLSERELEQIFHLSSSSITIGSECYQLEDAVNIHPSNAETIMMDQLTVHTEMAKDYSYKRTIVAVVDLDQASSNNISGLENQFAQLGEVSINRESDEERIISVSFAAMNQAELEHKTMQCLNAPTFIAEYQVYTDNGTVNVERTEFFDLEQLLRPEGKFLYSFKLPSYCKNVGDSTVTAQNTPFVTYSYERDIQFSTIEIQTDFTNLLGKINRTIVCTLPVDIAYNFRQTIKDAFIEHLCNGVTLDIYDENGMRYYKCSYSAWRASDIEKATATILNNTNSIFNLESSWLPLGKSMLNESFDVDSLLSGLVPADRITSSYTLSKLSFFQKSMAELENAEISGQTVTFQIRSGNEITINFRYIHVVKCVVILLIALVTLVLLIQIIRKIRCLMTQLQSKKKEHKHSEKKNKNHGKARTIFCPHCGNPNEVESRFCKHCGKAIGDISDLF